LASEESFKFASWLVAQEGDGVIMLLPMQPVRAQLCPQVDRASFGERWDAERDKEPAGDPLEEGGMKPMSKARKAESVREDPLANLEPQLEVLPPEDQLPFADLPGESLYFRSEFGNHLSFDLWVSERRSALPLTDEMLLLFDRDWDALTRSACMGQPIPKSANDPLNRQERQNTIGASRRIGLRYLVVDRELYGKKGMEILEEQLSAHLVGKGHEFSDGSGVTIFELVSLDVMGPSLRSGAAGRGHSEQ